MLDPAILAAAMMMAQQVAAGSPPVNTATPVMSGNPVPGRVVSVTDGTWDNSPTSFAYQWRFDDNDGGGSPNWVDIPGATSSSYTVAIAQDGYPLGCEVTATNAAGSAAAASNNIHLWHPRDAGSNAFAFYDHMDESNINVTSGKVDSIADSLGNAENLTNTGTRRPNLLTNQINGLPVVEYDGSGGAGNNQFLEGSSLSQWKFLHDGTVSGLVCVTTHDPSGGSFQPVFNTSLGATSIGFAHSVNTTGARVSATRGVAGSFAGRERYEGYVSGGGYFVQALQMDLTNASDANKLAFRIDGAEVAPTSVRFDDPPVSSNHTSPAKIGLAAGSTTSTNIFNGNIALIIVFNGAFDAERAEGYAAWRTGREGDLPGSHAYNSAPPSA